MSALLREAFDHGVTFDPSDDSDWFDRILDAVSAQRQATLVGLSLRLPTEGVLPEPARRFRAAVTRFVARPAQEREIVAQDPMFMIWLMNQVRSPSDRAPEENSVLGIETFEQRWDAARAAAADPGLQIGDAMPVRRFDVDRLLIEAAPPTYEFQTEKRAAGTAPSTAYDLDFFAEVGSVALRRITERWPALGHLIPSFVRLLIHVPDGEFRSASAARYTGVVFLTADDETMLDLEESIVHEYGHQVLYRIMELDPLIADQAGDFSLPWSGAVRDFYGYFHAFCIYMLLAEYFSHVISVADVDERNRAEKRREAVLDGIERALPDFPEDRFTPLGRQFLRLSRARATELLAGQRVRIST